MLDLVSEHVTLRRTGRSFTGLCPFHREKTPSFNVSPERGIFKCFGCGVGGDVFKFVQLIEKIEFMDALRHLAERVGIQLEPQPARPGGTALRREIARVNTWAASFFARILRDDKQGPPGLAFLTGKGISRESAERFGLGLASPDGGGLLRAGKQANVDLRLLVAAGLVQAGRDGDHYEVFRDRVMFPIRDSMNRVIGFGGRALGEARARYLNTAQNDLFDKGRHLYGMDLARKAIAEHRRAIIVEGYTDCIAAHQHGFHNVVATLGTAATDAHMNLVRRHCDEVLLVFDADEAGENAADRAIGVALQHGMRVKLARIPDGQDPCDYLQHADSKAFRTILNSAADALAFKWDRALQRFQSDAGGSDRRAAMLEFVQFVGDLSCYGGLDAIQRGLIANEIARVVNSPVDDVQRLLAKAVARTRRRDSAREPSVAGPSPVIGQGARRVSANDGTGGEDAEQAVFVEILEVLLNQPELWSAAKSVFEPNRMADPILHRIAERVRQYAERSGGFEIAELIGSFESAEETSRLTDLLYRGEARGNYEATLAAAVARLEPITTARRAQVAAASLLTATESQGANQEAELLRQLGVLHHERAGGDQFTSRRTVEEHVTTGEK